MRLFIVNTSSDLLSLVEGVLVVWVHNPDLVVDRVYHLFHLLRIRKDPHASEAWFFELELVFVNMAFENGIVDFSPVLLVVVFPVDREALWNDFGLLDLQIVRMETALGSWQNRFLLNNIYGLECLQSRSPSNRITSQIWRRINPRTAHLEDRQTECELYSVLD